MRAGRVRRRGPSRRRPDRVGLRRVRGAHDGRDPPESGRAGTCSATAAPGASRSRPSAPAPTASSPGSTMPRPTILLRPRPLLPRPGRALAGAAAGGRASLPARHRALSVLGYEHTLDEPAIRLWNDDRHAVALTGRRRGGRRPSIAIPDLKPPEGHPSHENATRNHRGTESKMAAPPAATPLGCYSNDTNAGRWRSAGPRRLLRPAAGLDHVVRPEQGRRTRSGSRPWPGRSATCWRSAG